MSKSSCRGLMFFTREFDGIKQVELYISSTVFFLKLLDLAVNEIQIRESAHKFLMCFSQLFYIVAYKITCCPTTTTTMNVS